MRVLLLATAINGEIVLPNGMQMPAHLLKNPILNKLEPTDSKVLENLNLEPEPLPLSMLKTDLEMVKDNLQHDLTEEGLETLPISMLKSDTNVDFNLAIMGKLNDSDDFFEDEKSDLNYFDPSIYYDSDYNSEDSLSFEKEEEISFSYRDITERRRSKYYEGIEDLQVKPDDSDVLTIDLTLPKLNTYNSTTEIFDSSHAPSRGNFDLDLALKRSKDHGYGSSSVRLRFAGTSLSHVDPIYLCAKRETKQCCEDKDPECFTPGGCFCDSSCRAFDDCCPDFEDHCADKKCLEDLRADIVSNYLRNLRRRPGPDVPSIASGGQPKHVEPNACCDGRPYNHGLRCCCAGSVTDECPCKSGA